MSSILPKMSLHAKDQLISKENCQAVNSSKKQTNEFIFTSMPRVFIRFLEEIEDSKKGFRNYLTFSLDFPYSVTTLEAARIQIMQNQHWSCFGMFDIQSFDKRCWLANICF